MEIDFMLSRSRLDVAHNVVPIEVKSGKNYTTSSLRKFMAKYRQELHTPFVLHDGDYRVSDGITYLPLYLAHLL